MQQEEGVRGEEDTREDDEDEAIGEAERLLIWSMVEGEDEVPSNSTLSHDSMTDERVVDLQRQLNECPAQVRALQLELEVAQVEWD